MRRDIFPRLNSPATEDGASDAMARLGAFNFLLLAARQREAAGLDAWAALEAAHVVGQTILTTHLRSHMAMLGKASRERDVHEMLGQLLRLALVPIGHIIGRLPLGNPGRANVSAFAAMPVRPEVAALIDDAEREALKRGGSAGG